MKQIFRFSLIVFALMMIFTGCSNLFERYYNEDGTEKTGDDSLKTSASTVGSSVSSGLVVIKNSAPCVNQITYNAEQSVYFVGTVPSDYEDYEVDYTNGTKISLHEDDDPVEFRAYTNDSNATVSWSALQTWKFSAELKTGEDANGETVTGYFSQSAERLSDPVSVSLSNSSSRIATANLPYGVTVVTCTVTADDEEYSSVYQIVLTKRYELIYNSGLVVLSAQDESSNMIDYDEEQTEYEITGIEACDNDMSFRYFLSDTDYSIEWSVIQVEEYSAVTNTTVATSYDSDLGTTTEVTTTTVTGQTVTEVNNALEFVEDLTYGNNQAISAAIPYGKTEVTVTITSPDFTETSYKVTLTRDIYTKSASSSSSSTSYSQLSELTVSISGDEESAGTLSPEFNSDTTVYRLTVDDDADSITINATAASEDAEISEATVITKYGTVPNVSGLTVPLVGGTSKITFTVTDESGVSRTYTIYVTKASDGDTSLSSLSYTPQSSYENGVSGFTVNTAYTGETSAGTAKYSMTLSADSRVDVSDLTFTAVPNNKRTTVAYGVSDSVSALPGDEEWSENYTYATQTSSSPVSESVTIGDESVETITRVLWVKTVSDSYYHYTSSGYETEKRSDTAYHAVKITKAGDSNQKLTELVVVATYEDGSTKTILSQKTSSAVAYTTSAASTSVTTYADKLDFYFRPLDKDSTVTYSANNTVYSAGENTSFTGYAGSSTSDGIESLSSSDFLVSSGYHFSIGEIAQGTGVSYSSKDLPNGTTTVKICDTTYNFVKPDVNDVSYSVSGWTGMGSGVDYETRESYIYIENSIETVQLFLNVTQQNASVRVDSVTQIADSNGDTPASQTDASYSVLHKDTSSSGLVSNSWIVSVGNATYEADGYTATSSGNASSSTIIPVGTTKLVLYVENNGTSKDYSYYIVRASDSESRLKSLSFDSAEIELSDWTTSSESSTSCVYMPIETAYDIEAGTLVLSATAVSDEATIYVTKTHSSTRNITTSDDENWEDSSVAVGSESAGSYEGSYAISANDAGSLMYTVTVTSSDSSSTHTYYIIVYVEADQIATLTALSVVQNGTDYANTILANSFSSETYEYTLSASLNYTGSIVITPVVYEKAAITECAALVENESIVGNGAELSDNVITLPYSWYSEKLGKTVTITYTVTAQDPAVTNVYTLTLALPALTTITETTTFSSSTEYEYILPSTTESSLVAYRFGSVIADESQFIGSSKNYFGGIDIIGTSDGSTWYESSFAQSGFQFVANVGGEDYWIKLDETGKSTTFYTVDFTNASVTETENPGINLTVTPAFQYEGETPYLALTFAIENTSGKEVKLGSSIDTLVGTIEESTNATNDAVTVEETDNGFTMKGSDYNFTVILKNAYGVDDVSMLWYGAYDSVNFTHMDVFENNESSSSLSTGTDSTASFSWELGSEKSCSKTIRITMGK